MHYLLLLILLLSFPLMAAEKELTSEEIDAKNAAVFEEKPGAPPCSKLAVHLYHCKPYNCSMDDPNHEGVVIQHSIRGLTTDNQHCRHLQTLPNNQVIDCKYSPPMQVLIAKLIITGANNLSDREKALMSETFEKECRVVDVGLPASQ